MCDKLLTGVLVRNKSTAGSFLSPLAVHYELAKSIYERFTEGNSCFTK